MNELSKQLKQFVKDCNWIFAKTYATTWPHEYIVHEQVDNDLFLFLAHHIDTFGYESHFYKTKHVYYDYEGRTYWHMGNIINRCFESDTYQRREMEWLINSVFQKKLSIESDVGTRPASIVVTKQ